LIDPFDGEALFTSAIKETFLRRSAVPNGEIRVTPSAKRCNSAERGFKVAARRCASSVNEAKTPEGGVQAEKPCASVDLRLT
jgi:hypothetical protein